MTQKLTERLQERLNQQTAEIEALTVNELKQLASKLQHESNRVLNTTQAHILATSEDLEQSLHRLRRFGKWSWVGLIVAYLMIGGLSVWHSMAPKTAGIELYQTFTHEGRTYLLLPDGTQALTCTDRTSGTPITCMLLPEGE